MRILVTGSNGFIGKNLVNRLESEKHECLCFTRNDSLLYLESQLMSKPDFIFHTAGVMRSDNKSDFTYFNIDLTKNIVDLMIKLNLKAPLIFTSSAQVPDSDLQKVKSHKHLEYIISKKHSELICIDFQNKNNSPVYIYRLNNIFGPGSKPNYNSVIANFCFNMKNNIPLRIDDPNVKVKFIYIESVLDSFMELLLKNTPGLFWPQLRDYCEISIERLADLVFSIKHKTNIEPSLKEGEKLFFLNLVTTYNSFMSNKN